MSRLMSVSFTEQAVVERRKTVQLCDNESGPGGAINTSRGLTHSLDYGEEGLAMKATSRTLTAQRLHELLIYDEGVGKFWWRRNGRAAGWRERTGYVRIGVDGEKYLAHRLAWLYVCGRWPDGELDHRNGNRGDYRIANLREIDRAANTHNLHGAHVDSKSGLAGVWRSAGRWAAEIMVDGRSVWLGRFDTPEQAHAAYRSAKHRLHPSWEASSA